MVSIASLKEREEFYKKEFKISKVKKWFNENKIKLRFFVIDPGSDSKIYKYKSKGLIILKPNISYKELKKKLIKYLPEDVYYDRNIYKNASLYLERGNIKKKFSRSITDGNWLGQELAFDVDLDNLKCDLCKGRGFCSNCLQEALKDAIKIKNVLNKKFKKVVIVYSGRGFHIHVRDKNAYSLTPKQRANLNFKFKNYAIDPWVSKGYIRLIRLPYSLHGLVSRIVTPLTEKEIKKFKENSKRFMPKFLS
ncbi:MAG: DNA primase small subunit domain-containing protein [Nanoarchaeota archaeon]